MTTGELIKAARKKAGLTQAELAHKLGLSFQAIAQWENNLRKPKPTTLQRIADALGVPAWYKLSGDVKIIDVPVPPDELTMSESLNSDEKDLLNKLDITSSEYAHIQKYRRLTDNGRATVDNVIDSLLEAGQPAREQEPKEPEKILKQVAARGGTGEPLEATTDTARLLEETKEWRQEQIKKSDVF